MNFDTTHEYHFYNKDNDMYYCKDHETLIVASNGDNTDRIMIEGIKPNVIKNFVILYNKKLLDENLENHNHSKDAVET